MHFIPRALPSSDITINQLPTLTAHRLVGMVASARLDCSPAEILRWKESKQTHMHHVCEQKMCVNPLHLIPIEKNLHHRIHIERGDLNHGAITGTPEEVMFD